VLTVRGHDDPASGSGPDRSQHEADAESGRPAHAAKTPTSTSSTDAPAAAGQGIGRFRLRNWRLRSKLAVVLLVPALSTLALAGLRLNSQLDDVELFGKVQRELQLSAQAESVADALQLERDAAVLFVAGGRVDNSAEHVTRASRVDVEVGKFRDIAATTVGVDGAVVDSFQKSLQALDALSALRNTMLTTKYPDVSVASAYSQILSALSQVHRATASSLSNATITPLSGANLALYSAKEQLAQQNAILLATAKRGEFAPGQADGLRSAQSRLDAALADFTNVASRENRQRFQDVVSGGAVDGRNRLVQLALVQNSSGQPVTISDAEVLRLGEETAGLLRTVSNDIQKQADTASGNLIEGARQSAWRDAALVAVALVVAFGLMAIVARSMLVPLRMLRRGAMEVARVHLPEAIQRIRTHRDPERAAQEALVPVPIHTTEEVGQVARAFDAVQREAVRLAVEQVALRANVNDMFINLSRRSQALVERQINVIDRLEQDEQDPDQLASLFELDHLATQMRRNSENLLVLSGTTVARRVTRPVPISEVLGAAVSEVEKYARVQIAPAPEIKVQGRVVNDLAHLVAELLDNATAFSKPTTKVTVRAIETRRGEISIRIHDRGVGMQEQDIVEANHKLSEPPEVDVSVAREMGLYVVGQLAKRHEIRVTLANNDDIEGGVTAQVLLPVSLLHRGVTPLQPGRPAPLALGSAKPGDVEESGVGVIVGAPKWTPTAGPLESTPAPFPRVMPNPADDSNGHHLVENTSAADLFTATVAETSPPRGDVAAIDYSYPPKGDSRTADRVPAARKPEPKPEPHTERLPIYEDVLSRWFQGNEASEAPVAGDLSEAVEVPEKKTPVEPVAEPKTEKVAVPPAQRTSSGLPKREQQPSPVPPKITAPPDSKKVASAEWGASDEGWLAANALLKSSVDDTTSAGLPKRVPNARLVPGSANKQQASVPQQPVALATAPAPRRSAERLRQQFATYQRGVQMGRESLDDIDSWDSPLFGSSAEKEQQ
jgi:signal transduction histidine kinase